MRVHSIIRSNNKLRRNLNNEYENGHRRNNETDILFYEILKKHILERTEENNSMLKNTNKERVF